MQQVSGDFLIFAGLFKCFEDRQMPLYCILFALFLERKGAKKQMGWPGGSVSKPLDENKAHPKQIKNNCHINWKGLAFLQRKKG